MEDHFLGINQTEKKQTAKMSNYIDSFVGASLDAIINSLSFIAVAINVDPYKKMFNPNRVELDISKIVQIGIFVMITNAFAYSIKEFLQTRTAIEAERIREDMKDLYPEVDHNINNHKLWIKPLIYFTTFIIFAFLIFLPFITDHYWADIGKTGCFIWLISTLLMLTMVIALVRRKFSKLNVFYCLGETALVSLICIGTPFLLGLITN